MAAMSQTPERASVQELVDGVPVWYHTMDVVPGVTTPGHFDLRPIVDELPWPDVAGKRCLDVGTFDGFMAFELERRGAAEVLAVDLSDYEQLDWPPDFRDRATEAAEEAQWAPPGTGFRLIAEVTGSKAQWQPLSIYDLDPARIGTFDVVVCGSLLLHLRDPLRALEAVRSVTSGVFLSAEQIEMSLTLLGRNRPLYTLNGSGPLGQWFNFNAAGHERLLYAAGFQAIRRSRPYTVRFNQHPRPRPGVRASVRAAGLRLLTGSAEHGVLHDAILARPRI